MKLNNSMKRITILTLALALFSQVSAQSEEVKKRINEANDRFVFEFNFNLLNNDKDAGFETKGISTGFAAYYMYDAVLGESPFSLAPGFGIASDKYRMGSLIVFTDTTTNFTVIPDSFEVDKSNMGLVYLDLPLELRFRFRPNKNNWQGKLAVGFKFGFKVASKWKYKGEDFRDIRPDNTGTIKFKEYNIPNMERYRYGVTARGGFGPFNLHFYYALSEIFKKDMSVDLQPLSFGISINGL